MRALSLFAALITAVGAAFAARAGVQAKPPAPTPTFTISGRGWGHGIGMGQDGAVGFARHGYGYAKILSHYYPGTKLTATSVRQVRVLLATGARNVTISSKAPFRVRDANGTSYPLAAGSYTIGPNLKVKVEAGAAAKALPGPLMFTPGRVPLELGRSYRGSMRLIASGGSLQAINVVGLEDYVRGVISQEMSSGSPAEALKAQAVASRSYVVATRKHGTYDVYPDTRSQVYGGVDAEEFPTNAAVQATAGKVLTYKGQSAITYYSASSGGKTAAIQDSFTGSKPVPYLVSVPDPYDTISPYHEWGPYVYTGAQLASRLGIPGKLLDARLVRNPSSRVSSVTLTTTSGQRTLTGNGVRQTLGLRSSWFSVGVLSLDRPAKPLVYGRQSLLTGKARGIKNVRIQRLERGRWEIVMPVERSSDGTFSATIKATAPGSYRAANSKVASRAVAVTVAAYVRLDPVGSVSSLTGRVRPIVSGSTVTVQRLQGGRWLKVATAKLAANGRFTAELDVQPGTYRARYAPGRGLTVGMSPVLRVVSR